MNQDRPWSGDDDLQSQVASDAGHGDAVRAREQVADAVLLVAHDGVIRWANGAAFQMFGYEPAAFVGQSVDMLVPGAAREAHAGHRSAYVADPVARPLEAVELSAVRADGSQFRAEISLSPLRQSEGVITVAVVRDLTEQHRRQTQAERLARLVLDGALDAYISTDSHSVVIEWNTTAETMFGWTRNEAVGRPLPDLIVPERRRTEVAENWIRFGGERLPRVHRSDEQRRSRAGATEPSSPSRCRSPPSVPVSRSPFMRFSAISASARRARPGWLRPRPCWRRVPTASRRWTSTATS